MTPTTPDEMALALQNEWVRITGCDESSFIYFVAISNFVLSLLSAERQKAAEEMKVSALTALDENIHEQNCYELDTEQLRDAIRALPIPQPAEDPQP